MKRPIESDYTSHVAYTRALEEYCDALEQQYMTNAAGELEPVTVVQTGVGIWKLEQVGWLYPEGLAALKAGKCWTAYGTKQDDDNNIPIFCGKETT